MHPACFYTKLDNNAVKCHLCRHYCRINDAGNGVCAVRGNRGGVLYSFNYGRIVAANVDPVEKKPLFHFLPASKTFSIAAAGCNFSCLHCQNHEIAQLKVDSAGFLPGREYSPEEIVNAAIALGSASISYTYTEPTVWGEFMLDTAKIAKSAGLKNIMVTNGYITSEALKVFAPYVDAANIDLKGFSESFYNKIVGGKLAAILDSIKEFYRSGIWIEVTTLLIPDENDSENEIKELVKFIAEELSFDIPWHISRFFPRNQMLEKLPTSFKLLEDSYKIGKEAGLNYVYLGNVSSKHESTFCPSCNSELILRNGYTIISNRVKNGRCYSCDFKISGVFA